MKKTILMLLLAAMSTGAMAEWVSVGRSGSTDNYVDPSTIRKNGKMVKIWVLADLNKPDVIDGKAVQSVKLHYEFDCVEERMRSLDATTFSGNMGTGDVASSVSEVDKWSSVAPESVGKALWNVACGKTKLK